MRALPEFAKSEATSADRLCFQHDLEIHRSRWPEAACLAIAAGSVAAPLLWHLSCFWQIDPQVLLRLDCASPRHLPCLETLEESARGGATTSWNYDLPVRGSVFCLSCLADPGGDTRLERCLVESCDSHRRQSGPARHQRGRTFDGPPFSIPDLLHPDRRSVAPSARSFHRPELDEIRRGGCRRMR